MCGIAGFLGISKEGLIERMLKTIRHRGPDAMDYWVNPTVPMALGHVRLSIIDLSERGNQPMWDTTGRFCIIYNGEIYNYKKLRSELKSKGCDFRSNTDTEVLLTLFREKGPSSLKELRGIWAFAIWDSKKRELFLSRDPLGVKPLYFVVQGDKFLFSSEIKSFLCWDKFSKDIDHAAVLETLIYLWTPAPRTMFTHVRKLLPGQGLTICPGKAPENPADRGDTAPGRWSCQGGCTYTRRHEPRSGTTGWRRRFSRRSLLSAQCGPDPCSPPAGAARGYPAADGSLLQEIRRAVWHRPPQGS